MGPGQLVIDQNIRLRFVNSSLSSVARPAASEKLANLVSEPRKLVVFFSWMLAKETHLEKYRDLYFKHGFDVLTVKTSPFQLFLPPVGSQKVASNVLAFLRTHVASYPNMLIHGFSVGGYQFGEVLVKMQEALFQRDIDANLETVKNSIKGMIFDSAVDIEGIPYGFSRAMVGKSPLAPVLEKLIAAHMRLSYPFATKHYLASSKAFHNTILRCPALMLVGNDDEVGNPAGNERVASRWRELGVDVAWKCWDDSRHVTHLHQHPAEYALQVDNFLKKIGLV